MKSGGQSLVELLLAMGLAAVLLPALVTGIVASRQGRVQQSQRVTAITQLRQLQEAVRSVRDKGWIPFAVNGTYHPQVSGTSWSLATGSASLNGFTQEIVISDAYRATGSGQLVPSNGNVDPSTKRIDMTVSWILPYPTSITSTLYLTRYMGNLLYTQTTEADFSADTLVQTAVTNTSGGEVIIATNTTAKWCSPAFSSATIDLPDGPPVSVDATASASIDTPNDVFVATSPYATSSAK